MQWLTVCLVVCTLLDGASAVYPFPTDPRPLHEVFQVDTRSDWRRYPSSCAKPLPRDENGYGGPFTGRAIYDSSKAVIEREENVLNNMWYQTYVMMTAARGALWPGLGATGMYKVKQAYSLVWSFFGIWPGDGPDRDPEDDDAVLLNTLRDRYKKIQEGLEHDQPDGVMKPKLFCNGSYWELQKANSPARQWDGAIIKRGDGSIIALAEWERMAGRNFEDSWYMWYDIDYDSGNEKGYMVLGKDEHPAISVAEVYPYPLGPTGQPDPCQYDTTMAQVFHAVKPATAHGTDAWHVADHVILCQQTFVNGLWPSRGDDLDRVARQPEQNPNQRGMHLDAMGVVGGTLAHEVQHVFFPDNSDDEYPYLPVRTPNTRQGQIHPDFPLKKSGFTRLRVRDTAMGAMQSMSIAMYETADPTTQMPDIRSIYHPESLMWFARTVWLTIAGRQDWSTGWCRPFDSPELLGPQAPIPEREPHHRRAEDLEVGLKGNASVPVDSAKPWEVDFSGFLEQE